MTTTRLDLIKSANSLRNKQVQVNETVSYNLSVLAQDQSTTKDDLAESVTHVLANLAQTAGEGVPLKLMHLNSIAAFMAGVETIANALPNTQDPQRVEKTLRVLQAAKVGPDGFVTTAVAPIAQLGARNTDTMSKYDQMIKDYVKSVDLGRPDGSQLAQAAKKLQAMIDRAMRTATASAAPASPAPTRPAASGTVPPTI